MTIPHEALLRAGFRMPHAADAAKTSELLGRNLTAIWFPVS
jgi:hypothetical protein